MTTDPAAGTGAALGSDAGAGTAADPAVGTAAAPVSGTGEAPVAGLAGGATGRGGARRPRSRGGLAATAVACGVSVAGLYYAQPLLPDLGAAFHVPRASAAVVVTAGQVGYAAGLLLVVPLGDLRDRRRLAVHLLALMVPALLLAAAAPALWVLAPAAGAVGVTAGAAQVLVALTAGAAPNGSRGQAVGTVMGGLTAGILLARVVSGGVAQLLGWRAVYVLAAVLVAATALLVRAAVPAPAPPSGDVPGYRALLGSTFRLTASHPLLRRRCGYGFAAFAAFSAFWTPSALLLGGPAYGFGEGAVGLFGLAGLAGVLFAQPAGRLADRGHAHAATGGFLALLALSFAVLLPGAHRLWALIAGAVLLDLGLRGTQTANQQQIYQFPAATHGRITTAYMTCYFAGGAVGSAASAALFARFGWPAVCALGAVLAAAPLLLWATDLVRPRHRGTEHS